MYRFAVTAILAAAVGWFSASWRAEAHLAKVNEAYQQSASQASARYIEGLKQIRKESDRMQKEKDDAIDRAVQRAQTLGRAADGYRVQLGRMRDDLSEANRRIADAPVEAVREYATTIGAVHSECEAELAETARAADGHASDVQLLLESWPVTNDLRPQ